MIINVIRYTLLGRRIQIAGHLTIEELEKGYKQATSLIERNHYQILWLLVKGRTTEEVAEITGYSRDRIYKLVQRYNKGGKEQLGDLRRHFQGVPPLLDDVQLAQVIQLPHPDGGLWNGPKVAAWMSELLERPIHPQRGWEYLRGLGMRLKRPRPEHQEKDPEEKEAWKKNSKWK